MRRLTFIAALGGAVLLLTCCRRSDDATRVPSGDGSRSDNPVLAVVGDRRITVKDFQAELSRHPLPGRGAGANEEQRQKRLQEMVQFEVLLARAKAAGFDRKPEIQSQIAEFIVARFQEDQLAKQAAPAPTDAEVKQFYKQHPDRFATPAAVRAALIYFKCGSKATDEKRAELKRKAGAVLAEARATDADGFRRLVQQHSDDQVTRYVGGDAGWLQADTLPPRFDPVVLTAAETISEPGAFAPLVETPDGFYIVRLLQRRPAGVRPFEQVKEAITYQLAQQRQFQQQQEFFEQMKQGLKIEMHPEALKLIPLPERAAESEPPRLPKS